MNILPVEMSVCQVCALGPHKSEKEVDPWNHIYTLTVLSHSLETDKQVSVLYKRKKGS